MFIFGQILVAPFAFAKDVMVVIRAPGEKIWLEAEAKGLAAKSGLNADVVTVTGFDGLSEIPSRLGSNDRIRAFIFSAHGEPGALRLNGVQQSPVGGREVGERFAAILGSLRDRLHPVTAIHFHSCDLDRTGPYGLHFVSAVAKSLARVTENGWYSFLLSAHRSKTTNILEPEALREAVRQDLRLRSLHGRALLMEPLLLWLQVLGRLRHPTSYDWAQNIPGLFTVAEWMTEIPVWATTLTAGALAACTGVGVAAAVGATTAAACAHLSLRALGGSETSLRVVENGRVLILGRDNVLRQLDRMLRETIRVKDCEKLLVAESP